MTTTAPVPPAVDVGDGPAPPRPENEAEDEPQSVPFEIMSIDDRMETADGRWPRRRTARRTRSTGCLIVVMFTGCLIVAAVTAASTAHFSQTDKDECQDNACLHGATCIDHLGGYRCLCSEEYEGEFCETDKDECQDNACLHGATCIDHLGGYRCLCSEEYEGEFCETVSETPKDCTDLAEAGVTTAGIHSISLDDVSLEASSDPVPVYCDMATDGHAWTVLMRRLDGSVNFTRTWADYKAGFGSLTGEFWIGNKLMYRLTSTLGKTYRLRVDLTSWAGESQYAEYDLFRIDSETDGYRLHLGNYSGDATDSFSEHDGYKFSTPEVDNDENSGNCADEYSSGWWYRSCYTAHLTGLYGENVPLTSTGWNPGIMWTTWLDYNTPLKSAQMKIRPV